jgi:signal transduction histidine kinase
MNDKVGCVDLAAIFEDGRLRLPAPEQGRATPQLQFETKKHPVWTDFFHTGEHCVYGEIDAEPPRARVATTPDGPWHDWLGSMVANPNESKMIERLSAAGIAATLCIPMIFSGKVTGMFSIRFKQKREILKEEIELTRAMTQQAMLALQLMRLSKQSREAAVMAERNRLARDIHDTLAQGFTGVIMQLEAAKGAMTQGNSEEVFERISRAAELARSNLGEARRSVRALRPQLLRDGKLSLAMDDLLKRMADCTGLNAEFKAKGDERLIPAEYEEELLRIAQESLTNTIKHANARNFSATLSISPDSFQLELADDGKGFDPLADHDGFGLVGMKERVDRMNGQFIIRSKPNVGTEILVVLKNDSTAKPENGNEQI